MSSRSSEDEGTVALSGQKCSVIMPTYNRPRYLARTLRYLSTYARNYPIIIADSGPEPTQTANNETVASYSSLDITYRTYPDSPEPFGGFESKIADALNHCDTKYCLLSADDDLVAPAAISTCVDFLEQNPDFTVAHGDYLYYWADPKSRLSLNWKPVYTGRSLTYSDPALRLEYHLSHYPTDTTYYAVHRTAFLKQILRGVLDSGLRLMVFRELYSTGITVIHGKTKHLNVFYCAKDRSSERVQYVPDVNRLRTTPEYLREKGRFIKALARYLCEDGHVSPETSIITVDTALTDYLNRATHSNPSHLEKSVIAARKMLYAKRAGWAYDYVKRVYRKIFPRDVYSTARGQYWIMLKSRLDWINYKDFKNIVEFVVSDSLN